MCGITMTYRTWLPRVRALAVLAGAIVLLTTSSRGAGVRFRPDDPLTREPETQDASKVQAWDINLFWDLTLNLFGKPGDPAVDVKARNVNTIDEVPDSNWFTNRIGARPVSIEEAARGPQVDGEPAAGRWSITRAKEAGVAPGFTMTRRERRHVVRELRRRRVPRRRDRRDPRGQQDLLDAGLLAGREPSHSRAP